jgi:signal transduction histidine kinase
LRQILLNLTDNALKYTETGRVRIDARAAHDDGQSTLLVSVSDTGIGIESADLERLFTAFERLDSAEVSRTSGTGLGLHLSRSLATLLGGDISVTSEPGVGSTFTLTLPLSAVPAS